MARLACCFFVFVIVAIAGVPEKQDAAWTESEWTWLGENFPEVLSHVLELKKEQQVLVSYRSFESLQVGEREYSFWIFEKSTNGRAALRAHVREPEEKPIGAQLLEFHRKFPNKPILEAERNLRFRDWEVSEEQCSGIRLSMQKLPNVPLGWTFETIVMDPRIHEFHIHSNTGTLDAAVYDEENPLVRWAIATRDALRSCGAKGLR